MKVKFTQNLVFFERSVPFFLKPQFNVYYLFCTASMEQLELLLLQFLRPDNEARKQAEEQIKRLSKDPLIVSALLHHMRTAPSSNVRQLAAVLLRKKIVGHWMKLTHPVRQSVKSTLLESITVEHRCLLLSNGPEIFTVNLFFFEQALAKIHEASEC